MKLHLIFVAVLANFCCHGVSAGVFERPERPDPEVPRSLSERFLPGLPGGQSVSQSESNSAPSTPSSTNFQPTQPTKFQLIEKFKEFLTNLEDQLQVFNENLEPQILPTEEKMEEKLVRNPRIGDAMNEEVSYTFEMVIRSNVTNQTRIEEAFEEASEEVLETPPNQIELGDYLYNQEDDKEEDYEGDYFYDFGNSPFAKSVDEMIQGF